MRLADFNPGSDLMLLNLAREAFKEAGWATKLSTGRYALKLGSPPTYAAHDAAVSRL